MSYDIELKNKVTGETATMRHPQYVRGGNVPARLNPITGRLEQAEQAEAHINITYNYSHYYYEATDDLETLRDLYDVAIDQIRIAMTQLNEKNVVEDLGDAFWCFLDWGDGLNKQAGATAVLILSLIHI